MATKAQYLYSIGEMAELVNHACDLERKRDALAEENARLREALEASVLRDNELRSFRAVFRDALRRISELEDSMDDLDEVAINAISIAKYALSRKDEPSE